MFGSRHNCGITDMNGNTEVNFRLTELAVDHRLIHLDSDVITLRVTTVLEIKITKSNAAELELVVDVFDSRKLGPYGEASV